MIAGSCVEILVCLGKEAEKKQSFFSASGVKVYFISPDRHFADSGAGANAFGVAFLVSFSYLLQF